MAENQGIEGKGKSGMMAAISSRIGQSPLARCQVRNPWKDINQKPEFKTEVGFISSAQPLLMMEAAPDAPADFKAKANLQTVVNYLKVPMPQQPTAGDVQRLSKKAYVTWGTEELKKKPVKGVCTEIASMVVAWLKQNPDVLDTRVPIEVIQMEGDPHHLVMIGRDQAYNPGINKKVKDEDKDKFWTTSAFVIDPWYGLQRNADQGDNFVKDPAAAGDASYFEFVRKPAVTVQARFTPEELAEL